MRSVSFLVHPDSAWAMEVHSGLQYLELPVVHYFSSLSLTLLQVRLDSLWLQCYAQVPGTQFHLTERGFFSE